MAAAGGTVAIGFTRLLCLCSAGAGFLPSGNEIDRGSVRKGGADDTHGAGRKHCTGDEPLQCLDSLGEATMMMKSLIAAAIVFVMAGAATAAPSIGGSIEAGTKKSAVCAACHGADGNSANSQFPRLAGQNAGYIVRQLELFKSGQRGDPIMSSMAANLSEQDMKDLAAYYAAQDMMPGPVVGGESTQLGKRIFHNGKPQAGVPACTSCHGPRGMGNAAAGFPRIAGQYAAYVIEELEAFHADTRGDYPKAAIMQGIAKGLSNDDINALATYINGLGAEH